MIQFGDLIRLQKRLPANCPLRLAPFINDPLAFAGEKNLDADAGALKGLLEHSCAGDPVLPAVLEGIAESLCVIRKAEAALEKLRSEAGEIFAGYDVTATGSLYQSDTDISHTLWLEAFKEHDGMELVFQLHSTLELKATWSQVVVFLKNGADAAHMRTRMQALPAAGWSFSEQNGPELHALLLENRILGKQTARKSMEDGKRVLESVSA